MIEDRLTYFIITRKIFDSAIWRDDPHILKLFIYLIGHARHSKEPKKYNTFEIKRGEFVTSLSIIADDNEYMKFGKLQKWSRAKVSRMLDTLKQQEYIDIISDTYGTHIKVNNYDTYQDPNTYKSDATETNPQQTCDKPETELNINNNDNNVLNGNNENAHGLPPKKNTQEEINKSKIYNWRHRKRDTKEPIHLDIEMVSQYFNREVNEKDLNELNNLADKYGKYTVCEVMYKAGNKMVSTKFITEEMLEATKQELEFRKNAQKEKDFTITEKDLNSGIIPKEVMKVGNEIKSSVDIKKNREDKPKKGLIDRSLIPGFNDEEYAKKNAVV